MQPFWQLEFIDGARNYIMDNVNLIDDIVQGLHLTRYMQGGIPPDGATEIDGRRYWSTFRHQLIIYRIDNAQNKLIVSVIKPI